MASIGSFSGLASGVQWRDMIDQIMQLEASRRITPLTTRADALTERRDAWSTFNGLLSKFSDAAKVLRDGSAFGAFEVTTTKSPTTGNAVLSASASTAAGPGTYSVEVRSLATQEKLRGGAVADSGAALGYSGTFSVNGVDVTVSDSDSLVAIRDRINAANSGTSPSGVTASIVDVGETEHYLTLTADATGANGVRLTDAGGVLGALGVSTGSTSQSFASDTTPLASLLGLSPVPAERVIVIDGKEISVNLQSDTLRTVLNKITAIPDPVEAGIVTGADGRYSLSVHGDVWGKGDDADTQAVLSALGFERANRITAGSDARVRIDGLDVVRSSNTITDTLQGVTLNLQSAEVGTTVNLTVGRDVDAVVKRVQELQGAYNALINFRDQQTKSGGPLHADATLRSMIGSAKTALIAEIPGVAGAYSRVGAVGLALNKTGTLDLDTEALRAALGSNFADVQALFGTRGTVSGEGLSFVSGTASTAAGDYTVEITRAATSASQSYAFSGPYTDSGSNANTMTLTDAYTGKSGSVTLSDGDDVAAVAAKLQALFDAEGMTLTASTDGTNLTISGTKYGSAAEFTVAYSRVDGGVTTASELDSPIGFARGAYAGLDVQGSIHAAGETPVTVTGTGRILTAPPGSQAEGLSVSYSGTAPLTGSASYVLGASELVERTISAFARSGDGAIAQNLSAIDTSLAALEQRQDDAQARLDRYEESLVRQYTAMEAALSQIQSQGSWLTAQIEGLQSFGDS
jgi:flagellar hook-associated protein 2